MLNATTADQRLAQGIPSTLTWTNVDLNGDPSAAAGAVNVTVTAADGSVVKASSTATSGTTGVYTVALTAAQTAALGILTATWVVTGGGTFTTWAEVVGRFYITIAELRAKQPDLADTTTYPSATLAGFRTSAELECEAICARSFVSRAARLTLSGTADTTLVVPDADLISVDSLSVDGTAFTTTELSQLWFGDNRVIERTTGDVFNWGRGNVVVAYRYGLNAPSPDLKDVLAVRVRELVNGAQSALYNNAKTYSPEGGGSYELDRAGRQQTGNPDVDAVYQRWSLRPADEDGTSQGPESRSMDMNSQYLSLFHGGRR